MEFDFYACRCLLNGGLLNGVKFLCLHVLVEWRLVEWILIFMPAGV